MVLSHDYTVDHPEHDNLRIQELNRVRLLCCERGLTLTIKGTISITTASLAFLSLMGKTKSAT